MVPLTITVKELAAEYKIEEWKLRALLRARFRRSHAFGKPWTFDENNIAEVRRWLAQVIEERNED